MSYYLNLSFCKRLIDDSNIYEELRRIANLQKNSVDKVIKSVIGYLPNYTSSLLAKKSLNMFEFITPENQYMLLDAFTVKFLYWKKFKLLAVVGPIDDNNYYNVEFYNNTDQDVELSTWSCLQVEADCRKLFNDIIQSTVNETNLADVLKEYEDFEESDLEYKKRSYVYNKIEQLLEIKRYLYDSDADIDVFLFGPNLTDKERTNIYLSATKLMNAEIENFNRS